MSEHNLGIFTYEEKLNEDDEDYHSKQSDSSENDSEDEFLEQEEIARTQQLRLQERLLILERTLNNLRSRVQEEREMWRREIDEVSNYCNGKCYEVSGDTGVRISQDDAFRNSNVSLDLDAKGIYAVDSYNERKLALQRQIAYSNFQRRLLEVENMCNLELLRIKQSAQFLEPLRVMVSEWNKANEKSQGDGEHNNNNDEENEKNVEESKKQKVAFDAVEMVGSKLYDEINEMFNKITPVTWQTNSSEEFTVSNNSSSATYISDGS